LTVLVQIVEGITLQAEGCNFGEDIHVVIIKSAKEHIEGTFIMVRALKNETILFLIFIVQICYNMKWNQLRFPRANRRASSLRCGVSLARFPADKDCSCIASLASSQKILLAPAEQKEFSLIPLQQKLHHKILLLKFMYFDFFSGLIMVTLFFDFN